MIKPIDAVIGSGVGNVGAALSIYQIKQSYDARSRGSGAAAARHSALRLLRHPSYPFPSAEQTVRWRRRCISGGLGQCPLRGADDALTRAHEGDLLRSFCAGARTLHRGCAQAKAHAAAASHGCANCSVNSMGRSKHHGTWRSSARCGRCWRAHSRHRVCTMALVAWQLTWAQGQATTRQRANVQGFSLFSALSGLRTRSLLVRSSTQRVNWGTRYHGGDTSVG